MMFIAKKYGIPANVFNSKVTRRRIFLLTLYFASHAVTHDCVKMGTRTWTSCAEYKIISFRQRQIGIQGITRYIPKPFNKYQRISVFMGYIIYHPHNDITFISKASVLKIFIRRDFTVQSLLSELRLFDNMSYRTCRANTHHNSFLNRLSLTNLYFIKYHF